MRHSTERHPHALPGESQQAADVIHLDKFRYTQEETDADEKMLMGELEKADQELARLKEQLNEANERAALAERHQREAEEIADAHAERAKRAEAKLVRIEEALDIDPLTLCANKRAFEKRRADIDADPNTQIIVFDGNNFGKINKFKEHGMIVGDQYLAAMGRAIQNAAARFGLKRRGDVFRLGGDEFAVAAPTDVLAKDVIIKNRDDLLVFKAGSPMSEAVRDYAVILFGQHKFVGTDQEGKYDSVVVSLSGTIGNTFTEADAKLQHKKNEAKNQQKKQAAHIDSSVQAA